MKQGWTYKKLGDVCEILDSKRKPITKGKREPGSIPYYGATGCLDYVKDYIFDEKLVLLGEDGAKWGPGESSAYIISGKSWVNNHAHALRPKRDIILDEILVYYLNYSNLQTFITGVTVPKLNQEKMRSIEVPVAPIVEQERIVERLDAAFAQIDELKSNAERQLAEARALFQSALTQAMQPKPGWQEKRIKDIADVKGGKRVPKGYKLQSEKTSHPYIRVADFSSYGTIDLSDIQYVSDEIFEQIKNYTITDKDLYVSIAGTIGKTGIIPSSLNGANLTENACKLVFRREINIRFVYLFTLSEIFKKQVEKATKQASQPKLALTRLAEVMISIPSISEQENIVKRLDALSNDVKELEEINRKTATECDALKQALLRQIFE